MFAVDEDRWENADTEHPTRHILSIRQVFEVSAVTFPAYSQTSIYARGLSEALDSAMESLESERTRLAEIEKKKQKIRIMMEM
jgi:phage head maturation protease